MSGRIIEIYIAVRGIKTAKDKVDNYDGIYFLLSPDPSI
jgi:hypothetical protein